MNFKNFYLTEAIIDDLLEKSDLNDKEKYTVKLINDKLTNKSKYVKFLIIAVSQIFNGDDKDEVIKLLNKFDKFQNQLPVDKRDINKYTLGELRYTIENLPVSKSSLKALEKNKGAIKVFENDKCQIFKIISKEAACLYGSGTKWCISAKNSNHFNEYATQGIMFYFIFIKNIEDLKMWFYDNYENTDVESIEALKKIAVTIYPDYKHVLVYNDLDEKINNKNTIYKYLGILDKEAEIFKAASKEDIIRGIVEEEKLTLNADGTYSSDHNIFTKSKYVSDGKLIIKFDKVAGIFDCSSNNLTTLEGCPKICYSFNCSNNGLVDLKYCPETVLGNFNCTSNYINSIEYLPKIVESNFSIYGNYLLEILKKAGFKNIGEFVSKEALNWLEKEIRKRCSIAGNIHFN